MEEINGIQEKETLGVLQALYDEIK